MNMTLRACRFMTLRARHFMTLAPQVLSARVTTTCLDEGHARPPAGQAATSGVNETSGRLRCADARTRLTGSPRLAPQGDVNVHTHG
jgi:hypothetical protein